MADQAGPSALRVIALFAVLAGTLGLCGCGCGSGDSGDAAAPGASSATSGSPPSSAVSTPAVPPSPTPSCVRGDKDWLDSNLRGRSVTGYLPIEFGGPSKLCAPVTVHVGYFDVSFTTVMDGAKPKQGYTVKTVDRQQYTVDGSALAEANPPSGGGSSASSCTGRLMVMSLGKKVGPGDIKSISWSQYEGSGAFGNVGISFKENAGIVRYDLQTPTDASAC
ncbi:hypothetical protein OG413_39415 [Streptomyces sp. NBC_01433]|uniref:hypothetical protein n=1 Tax=Streptomyces sp. NBC_01433 TaxID=2903864 RepID=UPI002255A70D|nr:hypothetical protein [Streptomyces sp. NBC_01433]MCX4681269.1 hypothetical protein [Streptomyces sp. NBC_01433]